MYRCLTYSLTTFKRYCHDILWTFNDVVPSFCQWFIDIQVTFFRTLIDILLSFFFTTSLVVNLLFVINPFLSVSSSVAISQSCCMGCSYRLHEFYSILSPREKRLLTSACFQASSNVDRREYRVFWWNTCLIYTNKGFLSNYIEVRLRDMALISDWMFCLSCHEKYLCPSSFIQM